MSDQANFLSQTPSNVGLVGHLEDTIASKMAPAVTARFGHRLPGFSGVTLPGSGQNIKPLPKGLVGNTHAKAWGARRNAGQTVAFPSDRVKTPKAPKPRMSS